ncbi:antibiotic biosynthesis monooxygenase [Roseibium sp. SCPC15]|jgi:antibiotic biosynthesis monooxygenase (ABM) superfamily enzyme|uniref:antibiotic biosynthesis monooxygenase n=1 Tax=Roseibium sp. SCP15 TaxID=3141376 RepID=UPI003338EF93
MTMPITIAVTDHVPLAQKNRYEALVGELHRLFAAQEGFQSVDTVRHQRPDGVEYTVLLRWANQDTADNWRENAEISRKLSQIEEITGGATQYVEAAGLGLWFDHPDNAAPLLPPFWKRVTLSVLAVYPMLMLLLALSAPLIGNLPQPVQVLTVVIVLSALLTWPIMPWLSKLLQPWLAPKSK